MSSEQRVDEVMASDEQARRDRLDFSEWVGKVEARTGKLPQGLGTTLAGVLDLPLGTGHQTPPAGVHWLVFDEFVPASQVGADGHPRRGGFLPPVELPRRMWAGGRLEFLAPLPTDERLTRTSRILSVTNKTGNNGHLVFVTVEHLIAAGSDTLVREEQDLVYMDITPAAPRVNDADEAAREPWRSMSITPDEVMLFRYSALTKNSHRIHYDADYARKQELYPSLVVHGPLTATLLMWFAGACTGGQPLRRFEFRGRAPLFVGDNVILKADHQTDAVRLSAGTTSGAIAMTGTVSF